MRPNPGYPGGRYAGASAQEAARAAIEAINPQAGIIFMELDSIGSAVLERKPPGRHLPPTAQPLVVALLPAALLEFREPPQPLPASCRGRTASPGSGEALKKSLIPVMPPPSKRRPPRRIPDLSGNNCFKVWRAIELPLLSGWAPEPWGQRRGVAPTASRVQPPRWSTPSNPARVTPLLSVARVLARLRLFLLRLPPRGIPAVRKPGLAPMVVPASLTRAARARRMNRVLVTTAFLLLPLPLQLLPSPFRPPLPPPLPLGPMLAVARTRALPVREVDPGLLDVAGATPAVAAEQQHRVAGVRAPALVPPPPLHRPSPPPPLQLVCEAVPVTPIQPVPLASLRASHRPGLLRPGQPQIWRIFLWFLTQSTRCGHSFEPCPLKHSLGPPRSSPRNICADRAMAKFLTARSRLRLFE